MTFHVTEKFNIPGYNTLATDKVGSVVSNHDSKEDAPSAFRAEDQDRAPWPDEVTSFDDMKLHDTLLRGIYAYGFEKPSKIQSMAIMPMIAGRDVIAQAHSGTGKTGTFSIAALQSLNVELTATQVLIMAPTRELATQTQNVVRCLGQFLGVTTHVCVGGTRVREDVNAFRSGVQVAVGTPGRLTQLIEIGALRTESIKLLILDEAHEMLSRGFKDQIYHIFQQLPSDIQVALISATMPEEILELSTSILRDPVNILLKKEEVPLEGIQQFYIAVDERHKLETLCDLYENMQITQAMVYCNFKRKVDWLKDMLEQRDHTCSTIHGDMEQAERDLVMREFRAGSSRVLITTDLLAMGIDVQQVSLVVNYDLPRNVENIHRIGRTGRMGKKGVAINLVSPQEVSIMRELEQFYKTEIAELPMDVDNLM